VPEHLRVFEHVGLFVCVETQTHRNRETTGARVPSACATGTLLADHTQGED
jgi:hypothetical protein